MDRVSPGSSESTPAPEGTPRRVATLLHQVSPWYGVVEAEVEEDGRRSTWHYQDHPGAAIAVPITPSGTVLVSAEYRVSVDSVVLEVPGGRIDPGEQPQVAALREMFEEIGATAGGTVFLGRFLNSPGSSNEITYAYAATGARVVERRSGTREVAPETLLAQVHDDALADASTVTAVLLALSRSLLAAGPQ